MTTQRPLDSSGEAMPARYTLGSECMLPIRECTLLAIIATGLNLYEAVSDV